MIQLALDLPLAPLPAMKRGPWYFVPWLLCAGLDWSHPLARATYDARHVELREAIDAGRLVASTFWRFRDTGQTLITDAYPYKRVSASASAGVSSCLLVRRAA